MRFLFYLFILISISLNAQSDNDDNLSWQSLTDSSFQYWNNDELMSVDFINRAKKIIPENVMEADTNYMNFIYMNGLIEKSVNKNLISSQKLFKKSIDLLPKVKKNNAFLLRLYFNYARVIDELEYDSDLIIDAYKKSIKYHLKLKNPHGPTLMWSYYYITTLIHKSDSDCSKVESYYEKIIDIYIQIKDPYDGLHFLSQQSNNALRICNWENEIKLAEYTFNYCKAYNLLNPDSVDYVVNQLLNYSIPNFLFNDKFNQTKEVLDFAESLMTNKKSVLYADILCEFAWYYSMLDEDQESISYILSAIDIYNEKLKKNHKKLFDSYDFLALRYWLVEKYFKAIDYYKKSIEVGELNNDIDQKDVQDNLISIADIYDEIGNNIKSKKYRNLANLGTSENEETGDYYQDLFELHLANEDYQNTLEALSKAEQLYFQEEDFEALFHIYVLAIDLSAQNIIFSIDKMDYFIGLLESIRNQVDISLHSWIDLNKGYSSFMKTDYEATIISMNALIPKLKENSEELSIALLYLSTSESLLGDVDNSILHLEECLQLQKHLYGDTSPLLIDTYIALSNLYNTVQPQKSMRYIIPALKLVDEHKLNGTIDHASLLGNYGASLIKNNNDEGLIYLKESIDIFETFEFNPNYHYFYSNLLELVSYHLGRIEIDKAIIYLNKTEAVLDKYSEDKSSLHYGDLYQYFGYAAFYSDNFQLAIENFDIALNIYSKTISEDHQVVDHVNTYKGLSLYLKGNKQAGLDLISRSNDDGFANGFMYMLTYDQNQGEALSYLLNGLENLKDYISTAFYSMSDTDKNKLLTNLKSHFESLNSHLLSSKINHDFLKTYLSNRFYYRGLLLSNTNLEIINNNNDSIIDKIKSNKIIINKLRESSVKEMNIIDDLIAETNELERLIPYSLKDTVDNHITYDKLQSHLKENDIYIELIRCNKKSSNFLKSTLKYYSDSIYYAAIIIEKDKEPELLWLDTLSKLEEDYLPYYYSHVSGSKKSQVDLYSYNFLFSKIIDYCGYDKTIYVSPDGVYNNINFETLYDSKKDKYLIETSDVRLVSSARKFIENRTNNIQSHTLKSNTAILIGNPKYDLEDEEFNIIASSSTRDIPFFDQDSLSRNGLYQLPGTQTEVQNISELLVSDNWSVSSYLGAEATENRVKEIFSPSLVHIATHGFFIPDKKTNSKGLIMGVNSNFTKDPLLRSGLLLAGAANTIKGNNHSDQNGILTSYEARELNLYNTDLVVLSACETGVGDYASGEGVYGLQRSIMEAGAKNVIMSLWKVDDQATQMLMNYFYSNLIEKKIPIRESLKQAKIALMKDYPSPYYWGAFVLIQD